MASRTWLTVILCFGVWWLYVQFFAPPPPKPRNVSPSTTQTTAQQPTSMRPPGASQYFLQAPEFAPGEMLRSDLLDLEFSNLGGKLLFARLNNYREEIDPASHRISPVNDKKFPFSFATEFSESSLKDLAWGEYKAERIDNGVRYNFVGKSGVQISKEYRHQEGEYVLSVNYRLKFPQTDRSNWGEIAIPVGGTQLPVDISVPMKHWEVVFSQNESVQRWNLDSLDPGEEVHQGKTEWLALSNRYFASVIVNESELNPDVVLLSQNSFAGGYMRFPLVLKEGGDRSLDFKFKLYIGPKDFSELSKQPGLKALIDYGWFSFLAYPLLWLLNFFYSFAHNYGVAIILLTILVRMSFYPLTAKSMRSMKSMQKLSPKIKALKEKYKDDRERFNREQMALFKAHKVNPAAGCLPMLIQLPVFIALYQVLANSMELFHAPFFGWIHDLSVKDPYFIYPILMGITMFIQQKMTPSAGMEPMQQKMMLAMPVIFTFIMLNLPSGLTLYIFVSTLLGIAQQYLMTKESKKETPAVAKVSKGATEKG